MKDELLILKGEWTVEHIPSSPMKGRRKGERTYASAEVFSGERIPGGYKCYADGSKEPLNRLVLHMAYCDTDPDSKKRAEDTCFLIAEAGTVYNETKLSPRQMVERIEELEHQLAMAEKAYNEACQHIRENTYPK